MKAITEQQLLADGAQDRREIAAEAAAKGRTALIGAVEDLTGLTIDHYAEINLVGFATLTQAIGGVPVCLAAPTRDLLSGANFPAGVQTISGASALAFVRQRHGLPQGDLSRIRRQQVFLAATADKLLSAGTLTNPSALGALLAVAQQSVVIDSGWDLLSFAQEAADIAKGNIAFVTIPTAGAENNSRGDVVLVDTWPCRTSSSSGSRRRTPPPRRRRAGPPPEARAVHRDPVPLRVDVRNGSNADGLGGQVMTLLRGQGFLRGTLDTTSGVDESVSTTPAPTATPPSSSPRTWAGSPRRSRRGRLTRAPAGGARRRLRPHPRARAQPPHRRRRLPWRQRSPRTGALRQRRSGRCAWP